MFRNYFKIAWRNLLKGKLYSAINILGLAIGMAVAMNIGLWVADELAFNHYHKNYSRLAQVMTNSTDNGRRVTGEQIPIPLQTELERKFGGDFENTALTSGNDETIVAAGVNKVSTKGIWAQPAFPKMLSLTMIKGSAEALSDVSSILISESLSHILFKSASPLGKIIKVNDLLQFKVAGVYADLPQNTTFQEMKFLTPWDAFVKSREWVREQLTEWGSHSFWLYAQINSGANFAAINNKIKDLPKSHSGKEYNEECFLHPMDKWHLYNQFEDGQSIGGRSRLVWLFGIIGIFVLLLACINFMNLATARSEKRAREVGVRKAIGSMRSQLIAQFLTESVVITSISLVISIGIVVISLPWFNQFTDKQIAFPWNNMIFWCGATGFTILVALFSGSYPAFYLSGFQPVKVLKGKIQTGRLAALPRRIFVVIQFTVSITLIVGTLVVYRQIQHAKNRPVGYNQDGLIAFNINTLGLKQNLPSLQHDLLETGTVENVAASSSPLTGVNSNTSNFNWKGKDPNITLSFGLVAVTYSYGATAGWKLKYGRDFVPSDKHKVILNEAAVKLSGLKQPVGETMHWNDDDYLVAGVVKDMVMDSPYKEPKPTVFFLNDEWISYINVRVKPGVPVGKALSSIAPVFKKHNPGGTFEYSFVNESYSKKFVYEQCIGKLATLFSALTVFISCIGLFGLSAFIAEQRIKEIGIRKVLGADLFSLWQLLSLDFIILVIISSLLAVPIARYYLSRWLQEYDYRIEIGWWIFAVSGLVAIGIALLTVSYQAIKAASANPVKNLRTE